MADTFAGAGDQFAIRCVVEFIRHAEHGFFATDEEKRAAREFREAMQGLMNG
jgi:hypothetical protein